MTNTNFLFELGCEELPAAALAPMAQHIERSVVTALQAAKFQCGDTKTYYTPRRLALLIKGLQTETEASSMERRGPAKAVAFDEKGAPSKALEGFLKSTGAALSDLFEVPTDKGPWLAVKIHQPAVAVQERLPRILEDAFKTMPCKKTMRWGDRDYSFLRPVHWVVALLGEEIVPLELFGIQANRFTQGHRFHAPSRRAEIHRPEQYLDVLRAAYVLVDPEERRQTILSKAKALVPAGTTIQLGTLEEVINLVEWPVPLQCHFEEAFLSVPPAVLISTMEANQRVFPCLQEGKLTNSFIAVANIESKNPAAVIHGNEKVVRARLADAQFFFDEDRKIPLQSHLDALKKITFQQGLGSLFDKTKRLEDLAQTLAAFCHSRESGNSVDTIKMAARLCKADLVTQMVQEFPELQGYMGHQYALAEGVDPEIALAIEDHYKPKGREGDLPRNAMGAVLALTDKVDTLVGMFAIGKEPTSSGDPFALRRQALGVIAILIERGLHLDLTQIFKKACALFFEQGFTLQPEGQVLEKLCVFFKDRLTAWCKEEKALPVPVINAILGRVTADAELDVLEGYKRMQALAALLQRPEGDALKELAKRIGHILQTKPQVLADPVNPALLAGHELPLYTLYQKTQQEKWINLPVAEQYLKVLEFQKPIADFFEHVLVNDSDPLLKTNRHNLLQHIHGLLGHLADFSKL